MNENDPRIKNIEISEEVKGSFLDYAMSVIVSRALPDVRDGLKPVHRRILYAMSELNLDPSKGYKKSARITGDTMGKYHPHGNSSIYDAMVRMAQDFSIRYMLVDGHGNFGSMDGDGAAAERYTEARLSRLSMELLADIDKETVDFVPNYDEEFTEPSVLPARFPNLLVNGSVGIAVGMSTNIPPHNLTDVISAVLYRIDHMREGRETDITDLIGIVKAPDYPTGGAILGTAGIHEAYRTGRGRVVLRADATIEPMSGPGHREQIRITAIPYQVNKANLVKKMADLVKDKKVDGITDIRDESNRNGVRIIIELRKDANANVVLNQLYKMSPLQESFGIIMLALVNKEPKILNLAEMIEHYIDHQKDVIIRRTQFDLAKAERRAHILEGLLKALDHIDEIIALIRSSADTAEARAKLMERFGFSELQAQAIVDMRLRALTGLERDRLQGEYDELQILIAELRKILADEGHLLFVLKEELTKVKDRYGDARRTAILHDPGEINMEDLIDDAQSVITISNMGYIKRIPLETYRSQARGGKGVIGMQTREEDWVKDLFVANTHDHILFFTGSGRAHSLRAFEIPEAGRQAKGMPLVNLLNLPGGETVAGMIPVSAKAASPLPEGEAEGSVAGIDSQRSGGVWGEQRGLQPREAPLNSGWDGYLVMVTSKGTVKRTALSQFAKINKNGRVAIIFREDDTLMAVMRTDGQREVFIASKQGKAIRFPESQIRESGGQSMGSRGIRLKENDQVIGASVADSQVLLVTEKGYGKCTRLEEFRGKSRGGSGVIAYKPSAKTGPVVGIEAVTENDGLIIINSEGVIIRIRVAHISVQGRSASGVKLINMGEGITVVSMAKITDDDSHEEDVETEETQQEE